MTTFVTLNSSGLTANLADIYVPNCARPDIDGDYDNVPYDLIGYDSDTTYPKITEEFVITNFIGADVYDGSTPIITIPYVKRICSAEIDNTANFYIQGSPIHELFLRKICSITDIQHVIIFDGTDQLQRNVDYHIKSMPIQIQKNGSYNDAVEIKISLTSFGTVIDPLLNSRSLYIILN